MSIDDQKAALRLVAKTQRKEAVTVAGDHVPEKLATFLLDNADTMNITNGATVAGYWAMADEVDVIPAMTTLRSTFDLQCALPVVVGKDAPLVFRAWQPGDALDSGGFGTHHPSPDAPEVTPDILLVPLLAFDLAGYRMGWGGGFYDRTLERLRASDVSVTAIGVAYAGQQFDAVVRDRYDQPMDWIVTEQWGRKMEQQDEVSA